MWSCVCIVRQCFGKYCWISSHVFISYSVQKNIGKSIVGSLFSSSSSVLCVRQSFSPIAPMEQSFSHFQFELFFGEILLSFVLFSFGWKWSVKCCQTKFCANSTDRAVIGTEINFTIATLTLSQTNGLTSMKRKRGRK